MGFFRRLNRRGISKASASQPALFNSDERIGAWAESRLEHYERYFGEPGTVYTLPGPKASPTAVDVIVYPPNPSLNRPFYTLITSGMSDAVMSVPGSGAEDLARAELLSYLAEDPRPEAENGLHWCIKALHCLAHVPTKHGTWLGMGKTVPNGDPPGPVTQGSKLTTAFLLPCFFESDGFVNRLALGGEKVNFYWVTYLSDGEARYQESAGTQALIDIMLQRGFAQALDPYREPIF